MSAILKNKQMLTLLISSFAVLFTGMGLFPILPLYAAQFDATSSTTGFYFAAMYAANALGPVAAGWLITRLPKKVVFVFGGLIGTPALLGLAAAQNLAQVVVCTSLLWFAGGVLMALVSIFTGLYTDEHNRGRAFSLMAMVGPLGSLVGGAVIGNLVTWRGYSLMFTLLAVFWNVIPVIGWLFLKEGPQGKIQPAARQAPVSSVSGSLGAGFTRLLIIAFLGSMAVNVSRFGSSLAMHAQQFSAEAVSSAAMVSGLVAIPATLAIGSLSDRLGRRHFLFASYLLAMSGSLILAGAGALWQFWLAAVLHLLAYSISGAMTQALATEAVPAQAVSKGLSYMNALGAAANILCYAVGGVLYDLLGLPVVFTIAAVLALSVGIGVETLAHPVLLTAARRVGVLRKGWKLLITR